MIDTVNHQIDTYQSTKNLSSESPEKQSAQDILRPEMLYWYAFVDTHQRWIFSQYDVTEVTGWKDYYATPRGLEMMKEPPPPDIIHRSI